MQTLPLHGTLPPCLGRWAVLACSPPRPRRLQLAGPLGRTRCLPYTRAGRGARSTTCSSSSRRGRALPRRSGACTSHVAGPRPHMAHASRRRSPRTTSGARCRRPGRMVGSTTQRGPLPHTPAIRVLLPSLPPSSRALLRSQAGQHAGAWLTAIPCRPRQAASRHRPMQIALRRRLRLPLPFCSSGCGPNPGCGGAMVPYGDHALACPRTGLLGPDVPKSSSARGSAWHVRPSESKVRSCRSSGSPTPPLQASQPTTAAASDLIVYGAFTSTEERCATTEHWCPPLQERVTRILAPLRWTGAALKVAERHKHCTYPELARGGPQKLLVLGSEIGGRWSTAAQGFVRDLVRLRAFRAPPAVRAAASSGWARRWWGSPFCRGPARRCEHGRQPRYLGRATALHWTGVLDLAADAGPPAALTRDGEPS